MKVEEIAQVTVLHGAARPQPGPGELQGALAFVLHLSAHPVARAIFDGRIEQLRAAVEGFREALRCNQLCDPEGESFFRWLREEKKLGGGEDWDRSLLAASDGNHAAAIERFFGLAAEFAGRSRADRTRRQERVPRFEPGWAKPPTAPFFVKLGGRWLACATEDALREAVRQHAVGRATEAFDAQGRILRLHLRPDRRLITALGKQVRPQAHVELVRRKVPQKMLAGALAALEAASPGNSG